MIRLTKKDFIWSLYKGDKFLDVGTIKELAERTGMKEKLLIFYSCPAAKKRNAEITIEKVCTITEFEKEEEGYEYEF